MHCFFVGWWYSNGINRERDTLCSNGYDLHSCSGIWLWMLFLNTKKFCITFLRNTIKYHSSSLEKYSLALLPCTFAAFLQGFLNFQTLFPLTFREYLNHLGEQELHAIPENVCLIGHVSLRCTVGLSLICRWDSVIISYASSISACRWFLFQCLSNSLMLAMISGLLAAFERGCGDLRLPQICLYKAFAALYEIKKNTCL